MTSNKPTGVLDYLVNNLRHSELGSSNEEVQDEQKSSHADIL